MRRVARGGAWLAMLTLAGCARIGEPPGGPPDHAAPVLIGTVPDSMGVYPKFDQDAAFVFNEVVAEGTAPNFGLGTGDLEKLIVVSPTEEVPHVHWGRSRITVKPSEGWRPNRVYRVELLPGIADLRNNRSKLDRVITFTTGAPIPTHFLRGRTVDWSTTRPAPAALVEATLFPDSLTYRTTSDSSGRFNFGPLPEGTYLVGGVIDQNRNRRLDSRELFDTIRVAATSDSAGELWMFRHDTVAARLQSAANNDSLSIVITFNQQLDPYQRIPADSVRVRLLPDSTSVAVTAILPQTAYDSTFKPAAAPDTATLSDSAKAVLAARKAQQDSIRRADSLKAEADRARAARRRPAAPRDTVDRAPLTTKPPLYDKLYIRLDTTLIPGAKYVIDVKGVRSVSGVTGDAFLGLQVPVPPKPPPDSGKADSAAVKPDSGGTRPDSGRTRPDSTGARPDSATRRPAPPDTGGLRRPRGIRGPRPR
jgi:Bacterial Ig-like domain